MRETVSWLSTEDSDNALNDETGIVKLLFDSCSVPILSGHAGSKYSVAKHFSVRLNRVTFYKIVFLHPG